MRFNRMIAVVLISALTFTLCSCSSRGANPGASQPAKPQPASTEPALATVKGADSVKVLMEKSLEFYHTGNYAAIADVHDRQAWIAWFLMEDIYRDDDTLTLEQAMDKAALLFTDAETLQAKDPELAELLLEEFDVEDRQEFLNDYMEDIKYDYQEGELSEDEPDAERAAQMLEDWDKGVAYMFEHYPELTEYAEAHWIAFDLESVMKLLQKDDSFGLDQREFERFRGLECEYSPEKIHVNDDGICGFDLGSVIEENDVWEVTMLYCVRNEVYYLIGYSYAVGSLGG